MLEEILHQVFSFVLGIQQFEHVMGALIGEIGRRGKPSTIDHNVGAISCCPTRRDFGK
jgi:hypothetical protein